MDGGPSQVDTFDPKPLLEKYHGQDPHSVFKVEPTQFNNVGKVMASPWKFKQHGQSGLWVSDLFPHVAKCVDDLAVVRSMIVEVPRAHQRQLLPAHRQRRAGPAEHGGVGQLRPGQREQGPARLHRPQRRPDPAGRAGQLQQRLPAGRVPGLGLPGRRPAGRQHRPAREPTEPCRRGKLDLLRKLDAGAPRPVRRADEIESAIANYETAFRMQAAVPELMDLKGESDGDEDSSTASTPRTRRRRPSAASA